MYKFEYFIHFKKYEYKHFEKFFSETLVFVFFCHHLSKIVSTQPLKMLKNKKYPLNLCKACSLCFNKYEY